MGLRERERIDAMKVNLTQAQPKKIPKFSDFLGGLKNFKILKTNYILEFFSKFSFFLHFSTFWTNPRILNFLIFLNLYIHPPSRPWPTSLKLRPAPKGFRNFQKIPKFSDFLPI